MEAASQTTPGSPASKPVSTGRPFGPLADHPNRRWYALFVMSLTVLVISLDQTVLNVAVPTLVNDLHPSAIGLQWIVDSYTLTNAVLLLFGGALGDRIGRRKVYIVGVALFGIGSLALALTHSVGPLIVFRSLMGLGASLCMPATLSVIASEFSGPDRARAIGIWAGTGGIGSAAGPLIGGWLLDHYWWGAIFLINVPIVVVAIIGTLLVVHESHADSAPKLDPIGVLLSAAGLTALTYAVISAGRLGWGSPEILVILAAGFVLMATFLFWDGRRGEPMIDLRLFTNRTFSAALGAVTAVFFAMFGVSYLLSQYIQFVQGVDVFGVGLRFIPFAVGTLITSNFAPTVTSRFGLRAALMSGMTLVAGGLAVFSSLTVTSGFMPIAIAFVLAGSGIGLVVGPASTAIINALPSDRIGAGSGLRSTVQLLGGSFGVAIIASVATSRYTAQIKESFHTKLVDVPAGARSGVAEQIGGAMTQAHSLPEPLREAVETASRSAFVSGLQVSLLVGLGVVVVAAVIAFFSVPPSRPVLTPTQRAEAAAPS